MTRVLQLEARPSRPAAKWGDALARIAATTFPILELPGWDQPPRVDVGTAHELAARSLAPSSVLMSRSAGTHGVT